MVPSAGSGRGWPLTSRESGGEAVIFRGILGAAVRKRQPGVWGDVARL